MAAHAPDHSAWHWKVEKAFTKIRSALLGKALGRSWTKKDPVQEDLRKWDRIRRCTESAMDEYTKLLHNVKNEQRLDWTVCARHPRDEPKDSPIPDAELIVEYYQQSGNRVLDPKFRKLRAESLDLGRHVAVMVPSCFELRACHTHRCFDSFKMCLGPPVPPISPDRRWAEGCVTPRGD